MLIPVVHHKGRHCASTGICNLVRHHGIPWSEAMCFGIGQGIGIWYVDFPGMPARRVIHVRSADYEPRFFTNIGHPFEWRKFSTPEESEKALVEVIDKGLPAIIQTDVFDLPYFNTKTHFPGHVITVWGYDRDRQTFFVSDTERDAPIEVPFANLRKARFRGDGFFSVEGNLFAPESIRLPDRLPSILISSILAATRFLMDRNIPFQGIRGLEKWRGELDAWNEFDDWRWCARFNYQVIERRGTGGGAFRLMYADFLEEAATVAGKPELFHLSERMRETGRAWQDLAMALKDASDRDTPDFTVVGRALDALIQGETTYHERVQALLAE